MAPRSSCPDASLPTTSISNPARAFICRKIVRQVLGPRGEDAVAGPERHRVERHVPGARGAFHERDLVPGARRSRWRRRRRHPDATLRFGGSLDAADGGLACEAGTLPEFERVSMRCRCYELLFSVSSMVSLLGT